MILHELYQVENQLSKRGGRETLLARNIKTQELVVIKLFRFGLDAQWEDFKLFEREAKTLRNLEHPAIPKYVDYFELDGDRGFALVQSYIEAPSLADYLRQGRTFSQTEIEQLAEAILNILVYLHHRQPAIIHRDIKPSNILLSDRTGNSVGQVYLVDFGAVKNFAATEGGTITVVGTYGYMPPEQFAGKTTPASDLYSLGATLVCLATGVHPAELPSKDGKINFQQQVNLSSQFSSWLDRAIEPSCDRRFTSATEALKALQQPISLAKSSDSTPVLKPRRSKIILHKTPTELTITIPPAGLSAEAISLIAFTILWNGFLILWTGGVLFLAPFPISALFTLFSIPFWAAGVMMLKKLLQLLFGKTILSIDSQQISRTHHCLGFTYHQPQPASRTKISEVKLELAKIPPCVVVWAEAEPYEIPGTIESQNNLRDRYFDEEINNLELTWLLSEIKGWLNI